jgi:hypothetical protein
MYISTPSAYWSLSGSDASIDLFGRKILGRPDDLTVLRQVLARGRLRDPEVEDLHLPPRVGVAQEDVRGLEIAVNDADLMACAQRRAHAQHDVSDVVDRQRRGGLLDQLAQAPALQILHHHVGRSVVGETEVQHLDDVAMVDARCGQRLAHEPFANLLGEAVAAPVRDDGLERDGAPQLRVDGR